jgi:ubiquitin carboxyl-terminal hydrolase 40
MLASLFGDDDTSPDTSVPDTIGGKVIIQRPPEERAASMFIGLENQGATCYLNSLLQSMYMTPELRFGLFQIDPVDLGVEYVSHLSKNMDTFRKNL